MSNSLFDEQLELVKIDITKQWTVFRNLVTSMKQLPVSATLTYSNVCYCIKRYYDTHNLKIVWIRILSKHAS